MTTGSFRYLLPVLCISPVFVPTPDPEAVCGAKMVQALMQRGAAVTVLCSSNFRETPHDDSALWDCVKKVIVGVPVPPLVNRIQSFTTASWFQTLSHPRRVGAAFTQQSCCTARGNLICSMHVRCPRLKRQEPPIEEFFGSDLNCCH
jgi:hypothetical protein